MVGWRHGHSGGAGADLPKGNRLDEMNGGEYAKNDGDRHGGGKLGIVIVVGIAGRDGHIAIWTWRRLDAIGVAAVAAIVVPIVTAHQVGGRDDEQFVEQHEF